MTFRTACVFAIFLAFALPASASEKRVVGPGPTKMSADEIALAADPAKGIEHAIILSLETDRDDTDADIRVRSHMRVKILSADARDWGNIKLPFTRRSTKLVEWWGRVILPDGTVHELPQDKLHEETLVKSMQGELRSWTGALPGIVPGCVIDYGYEFRYGKYLPSPGVPVQFGAPVRDFYYRWTPADRHNVAVLIRPRGNAFIDKVQDEAVVVTAKDLPAVPAEPMMPPLEDVRSMVYFFYLFKATTVDEYWRGVHKPWAQALEKFEKSKAVQPALPGIGIPAGDLRTRMVAVQTWIETAFLNTAFATAEERAALDKRRTETGELLTAEQVLGARRGTPAELSLLFMAVARALGYEAEFVFVADRTERQVSDQVLDMEQVDNFLVAVRERGAPDDKAVVFAPGLGRPAGEIPWHLSGQLGLLVTKDRTAQLDVPAPSAETNTSTTSARISFADDERLAITWSRTATGQRWFRARDRMREAAPADREKLLTQYCGANETTEITKAVSPNLAKRAEGLQIECTGTTAAPEVDDATGELRVRFDGPWVEAVPDLPAGKRMHMVVFDLLQKDTDRIVIVPPAGFVPAALPEPQKVTSTWGSYTLSFSATPDGVVVERTFALTRTRAVANSYGSVLKFFGNVRRVDATPIIFRRATAAAEAK